MTHTPGPWHLQDCPAGGKLLLRGTEGKRHLQSHLQIVPTEDAILIASAPDLLQTLRDIAEWLETDKVDGVAFDDDSALDAIRAAIAKAEGKEI